MNTATSPVQSTLHNHPESEYSHKQIENSNHPEKSKFNTKSYLRTNSLNMGFNK